jgi:hypothetical protein
VEQVPRVQTGTWSSAFLAAGTAAAVALDVLDGAARAWLFVAICIATSAATVAGLRRLPRGTGALLVLGMVLLLPAYVLWYPGAVAWRLDLGSPSVTDALFIAAYLAFFLALAGLIRRRDTVDGRVQTLDSLIVSVGLGVLAWVFLISPYLRDDAMSGVSKAVAVSYPLLDLLLLGTVVRLVVQRRVRSMAEWFLTLWVLAQLAADLVYTVTTLRGTWSYEGGAVFLYGMSFVLLGAAVLHPTIRDVAEPGEVRPTTGARRFVFVSVAALIAPTVLVVLGLRGETDDVAIVALLSAVLFGLVLARVALLMVDVREHRRIREQLSERHVLAERLSRIQRKISSRVPLQDVLDAITAGAAELLRDEVVGLRLVDEDDPGWMVMVSSIGVLESDEAALHRLRVGDGVGGRAIVRKSVLLG